MPKIKTRSAAAKRFEATGSGKFKRAKAFKNHKLGKKVRKTKRILRAGGMVSAQETKTVAKMCPYK